VDGGHQTFNNTVMIVQNFGDWGQTIGGATGIAYNILRWIIIFMIDSQNIGGCVIFGWG